jgi:hypothetical protein
MREYTWSQFIETEVGFVAEASDLGFFPAMCRWPPWIVIEGEKFTVSCSDNLGKTYRHDNGKIVEVIND